MGGADERGGSDDEEGGEEGGDGREAEVVVSGVFLIGRRAERRGGG